MLYFMTCIYMDAFAHAGQEGVQTQVHVTFTGMWGVGWIEPRHASECQSRMMPPTKPGSMAEQDGMKLI